MNISAVIITLNEQRNIVDCVNSLRPLCDDIIVADTGSTDATCDLAREAGARIERIEWRGYAESKNLANDFAVNDWVLSLDADERLSDELVESLRQLTPTEQTVYLLDRFTNYCGHWVRYSGWYPEWKARLFNRKYVSWQGEYVHEALAIPDSYQQRKLPGKLYHYSYYTVEEHRDRLRRYADLSAQKMLANGKRVSWLRPWISSGFRFVSTYLLRQGIRDGQAGWRISCLGAREVFLKYRRLRQLQNDI